MATTGAECVRSDSPAMLVGFGGREYSFPIRPGRALGWALVALGIANLGAIPVFSTGDREVSIVLNDVLVVGLTSFALIAGILRRSLWLDSVGLFALAFAAVGFGSAVAAVPRFGLTPYELAVSLSYLARWLVYFGVYLFVINNVRSDQVTDIWRALAKVMLAFAIFGVFQSFFLPDFAQMVYPDARDYIDWDPQGHRLVSSVLDPNLAAAMLLLVLLVQLAQIACGATVKWWQPAILILGLALTLSRSGILALAVGVMVILLARGISVRLLRLFGVVLFFSVALVPRLVGLLQSYARFDVGQGSSAGTRVLAWLIAAQTIADHPVFGVGFNTYGYVKALDNLKLMGRSSYGSDGGLLFVMVMTGIVGLLFYILMLRSVIRRCRRVWRSHTDPEVRGLAIGVAAGAVSICVHSIFANSLFTTFVMEILWVTWGLVFVVDQAEVEPSHGNV